MHSSLEAMHPVVQINTLETGIIFPKGLDGQTNHIAAVMQLLDTMAPIQSGDRSVNGMW